MNVRVPIEAIGGIQSTLRQSYNALAGRRTLNPESDAERVWAIIKSAQRPDGFDMMQEPISGDLVFVYRFRNQAPMALRVDMAMCIENMANATRMIRSLSH